MSTFVPDMSTNRKSNLASALFTKSLQEVLAVLFAETGRTVHLRGIVQATGQSPGTIHRVLERLYAAGIVSREQSGNQVLFQANRHCPIYAELVGITVKTVGLAEPLKTTLEPITGRLLAAFIFGSVARQGDTSRSDVDLFVLGNVRMKDVAPLLTGLQNRIGREINPVVYTPDEYQRRLREGNHFLQSLQNEPKIFLIGSDDELRRLVEQ